MKFHICCLCYNWKCLVKCLRLVTLFLKHLSSVQKRQVKLFLCLIESPNHENRRGRWVVRLKGRLLYPTRKNIRHPLIKPNHELLLGHVTTAIVQGDSFGTRPKKMRISQRLFIRFWTCIYDYVPCFMRSMSILVCRSLTSWRQRDNDWRLAPCRAQPCHCVVR